MLLPAPEMDDGTVSVLIVGGGIAGLATARALRARGIEARVLERAASHSASRRRRVPARERRPRDRRARALAAGLAERAQRISQQRFLDQRGRVLMEVDLDDVWGATGPCLALPHADLHDLLQAGIPVSRGSTVTDLDAATAEHDLVVGADGVRSWVRTSAFPGSGPRFLGQVSWRFVDDHAAEISAWTVWLGRRATFLAVPLGGGRTYCYAAVDRRTPSDPAGEDPSALTGLFEGFAEPVPTLLAGLSGPPYFSPIEEVVQEPWTRGQRGARRGRRSRHVTEHGRGSGHGGRGRPGPRRDRRGGPAAGGLRSAAPAAGRVRPGPDPPPGQDAQPAGVRP